MAHQNIQSLSCKVDQLRILLRNDLKNGLQILTLSETWAKRDLSDGELDIPGYKLFRKDRDGRNDGVAAYVRDDILVTRRDDLEIDSVEGLWLEIVVTKSRNFLLGTFYRPDSSSQYYDNQFMTKLDNILACAAVEEKETILTGDFNCCFMSSKRNSPESKQLKSLFKSMSFKHLIASPTRMVKDSASLTDLIATNCPQNISNFGVVSLHLSEHELVYCIRKLNWKKAPAQMKTFRNYANYGSSEFRRDLDCIDWNLNSIDGQTPRVNELWDHFKTSLVSAADKHAPVIHKRVRGVDVCPWLNKNIKINMRRRDFLLKKARKTNYSED